MSVEVNGIEATWWGTLEEHEQFWQLAEQAREAHNALTSFVGRLLETQSEWAEWMRLEASRNTAMCVLRAFDRERMGTAYYLTREAYDAALRQSARAG